MHHSEISEKQVVIFIMSIIFLFIAQELLIINKYIGEPYPALKMPGFSGNTINEYGYYEMSSMDIKIYLSDESTIEKTPKIFFSDAPVSHHGHITRKFHPVSNPNEVNKPPKVLKLFEPIFPGYFVRYRNDNEVQNDPETVNWLLNRINEIDPENAPIKIKFIRYRNLYNPENLEELRRELNGETIIEL